MGAGAQARDFTIKNSKAINCHSLAQVYCANFKVINCKTINTGRGVNLQHSSSVLIKDCDFAVTKYAVRAGQSSGSPREDTLTIINCKLSSESVCSSLTKPETAIVLRGDAPNKVRIINSTVENTNSDSYAIANETIANSNQFTIDIVNTQICSGDSCWNGSLDSIGDYFGGLGDATISVDGSKIQ